MSETIAFETLNKSVECFQEADVQPPYKGSLRTRQGHTSQAVLFLVGKRWVRGFKSGSSFGRLRYSLPMKEVSCKEAMLWCCEMGIKPPPELTAVLSVANPEKQPKAPQAAVSDPGGGTSNLSTLPRENKPEADADVWIDFALAREMTGLKSYEITRACNSGDVRWEGKGKARRVHSGDIARFMDRKPKDG